MLKNGSVFFDILIFFLVVWAVKQLDDNIARMIGSGAGILLIVLGAIRLYVYIRKTKINILGFFAKAVIALVIAAFSKTFWYELFYMKHFNVLPLRVNTDDIEFYWTVNTAIYVFLLLAMADKQIESAKRKTNEINIDNNR